MLLGAEPAPRDVVLKIDGQNLHLVVSAEVGPTVVFEAGLGNDVSTWRPVAPAVAKFACGVLYDRGRTHPAPQ